METKAVYSPLFSPLSEPELLELINQIDKGKARNALPARRLDNVAIANLDDELGETLSVLAQHHLWLVSHARTLLKVRNGAA